MHEVSDGGDGSDDLVQIISGRRSTVDLFFFK